MNYSEDRKYLSVKRIATGLSIPQEFILQSFDRYKKRDGLKEGTDYISKEKELFFSLEGLLWILTRCDVSSRDAEPLVQKLAPKRADAELLARHELLLAKIGDLKAAIDILQGEIDGILKEKDQFVRNEKKTYYKTNAPSLPNLTGEEIAWSKKMHDLLAKKAKSAKKMPVHVQKQIYTQMNRKYGIVFPQKKKDFLDGLGLDPATGITTFRLIVYDKHLRQLYEAMLEDYAA